MASLTPAGEVVAVWTTPEAREVVTSTTVSAGGASFPDPGAARPVAARITVHAPDLAAVTPIQDLAVAHITVQPMPGGRFLVAGARGRWRAAARTATRCSTTAAGRSSRSMCSATGSRTCWPPAPARSGPVTSTRASTATTAGVWVMARSRSARTGSSASPPTWSPPGTTRKYTEVGPWDAISDCYALNVDDASTWACYDSDFPVVRIRDGAVTGWHNDIKGASALAVAGSRVALVGGYGPDHDRLAVMELDDERARLAGEYRVVFPDGEPLAPGTQVIGRGSRLHFLTGSVRAQRTR